MVLLDSVHLHDLNRRNASRKHEYVQNLIEIGKANNAFSVMAHSKMRCLERLPAEGGGGTHGSRKHTTQTQPHGLILSQWRQQRLLRVVVQHVVIAFLFCRVQQQDLHRLDGIFTGAAALKRRFNSAAAVLDLILGRAMVLCDQVDWRSSEQALELDLSLVQDVFHRLAKLSDQNQLQHHRSLDEEQRAAVAFEDRLFTKSDVLVALEQAGMFLQKRPYLRMLHTRLACVSNEKEGRSVAGFVRYRVREPTLSFAMAKSRLLQIYKTTQASVAFEKQVQASKAQVHSTSLWCVRNPKSYIKRPSQFYGVHVLPVKPKSERQIQFEQQIISRHAAVLVQGAIQLVMDRLLLNFRPRSGKSTGRSTTRSNREGAQSRTGTTGDTRKTPISRLAIRAQTQREQAQLEEQRRRLRIALFAPQRTPIASSGGTDDTKKAMKRRDNPTAQEQLLATIEANGDARLAERLLNQPIARAGFRRTIEQATNLDLPKDDDWGLVQIWRRVYRKHTVDGLRAASLKPCVIPSKPEVPVSPEEISGSSTE